LRVTLRKSLKILSVDETGALSIDTRNTSYLEDTLWILAQTYWYVYDLFILFTFLICVHCVFSLMVLSIS
jgi:hypothetical protein